MHARHKKMPGNGYWSHATATRGQASSSRMSSMCSMRGRRNYSDYRNNKRGGFARSGGQSKQFQLPMPPSRGTDIFMEAGRLAAEYLVSKGVLPPNALSGKWQSDRLKNQMGEFQGFIPHDVDNTKVPTDGRVSAHARLENTSLDDGTVRRRYCNDYTSLGSTSSTRESRRSRSFKNYGLKMNRELRKSESWGERSMAYYGSEADGDASSVHSDGQALGKDAGGDGGMETQSPGELFREDNATTHPQSGLEKCNSLEVTGAKAHSPVTQKYQLSNANEEPTKECTNANKSNAKAVVANEGENDIVLSKKLNENVEVATTAHEDTLVNKRMVDLLRHCKFAQFPTKPRSSLTNKGSKGGHTLMNQDENVAERGFSVASVVHVLDSPDESLGDSISSHQIHKLNSIDSDVVKAPAVDKELEVKCMARPEQHSQSSSYSERSVREEVEVDEGLSALARSNSLFICRGDKRAMDDDTNDMVGFKKHREWAPTDTEFDGCLPLSSSMEIQLSSEEERTSQSVYAAPSFDQKSLNISLFPKNHDNGTEEKLLFPGSFKTCDLNLVGTCDSLENQDGKHVFVFPSVIQTEKESAHVDVGLSISNSCNSSSKNAKLGVYNDIEIIDLENDSAQGDQTFGFPERRPHSLFTNLDGFPNNVNNVNEIPDVQDGYGLMFSELLGHDSPSCSAVSVDLNSLHNAMGLPHAEGILGDDDSIYMSLGEIPISFLGTWEQPTHDYGKPF